MITKFDYYAKTLAFCGPFVVPMIALRVFAILGLIAFIALNVALWWNVSIKL